MTAYFNSNALLSQRSSGYKGTTYALSELIDNSFDAGASECKVIFIEKRKTNNEKYIDEILIVDDGEGMSDSQLEFSLQFGGTTNEDLSSIVSNKKIGKFGFGLPSASISQCEKIAVLSWNSKGNYRKTTLDLQSILKSTSIDIPPIEQCSIPAYYEKLGVVINKNHGTIVSWKECDRLSHSRAETIMNNAENLVGRIFRHYIAKDKKIIIERYEYSGSSNSYVKQRGFQVRINDPLFLTKDAVISSVLYTDSQGVVGDDPARDPKTYYQKYSLGVDKSLPTNVAVKDKCYTYDFEWKGKVYSFDIKTTVVEQDIQKPGIRDGGGTDVGRFYGRNQRYSICFVRSDREIAAGSFRGIYNPNDVKNRWWAVEVSFTPDADDLLGVHVNKQGIDFRGTDGKSIDDDEFNPYESSLVRARTELWVMLTRHIGDCIRAAKKIVNNQQKVSEPSPDSPNPLPEGTNATKGATASVDGVRHRLIDPKDKEKLIERLSEKYPDVLPADINDAVEYFDKSKKRSTILYVANDDSMLLWSTMGVYEFKIVLINTSHQFYERHMHDLRESHNESALSTIELFICSLALEEEEIQNEDERGIVENYRAAFSLHLSRYLKKLPTIPVDSKE
jgi:hypothetical protein